VSSIIRSISLDTKTAKIAKRVPNFSKFVRQCLLQWEAIRHSPDCPVERLGHGLVGDHCVPAPTRVCLKHWPVGTPRIDRLLRGWPHLADFNCPEEWIQHRAELVNDESIDFTTIEIEGNAKPGPRKKKSKIRRLWAVLSSKK